MKKQELLSVLEKVKPGLANKDMIVQASSFAFIEDSVVTFNDEISVRCKLPGTFLSGAVKAEELYKFLSKINTDEIELTQVENEIRISSGKAKAGLVIESEIRLPLDELGEIKGWTPLPADFLKTIEVVRFCCSNNMSKPICTCIHVRRDGIIEAFDNYRAIRFQIEKIPYTFLLPEAAANQLIAYPVTQMASSEGWVHFADEEKSLVFSCRIFGEAYFNLDPYFQIADFVEFAFPIESLDILARARVFSKTDVFSDEKVEISAEKRRLFFRVKSAGSWFEEWVKIEPKTDFRTYMHPQFLQDILKLTTKCQIVPGRMIKFYGDNWEHTAQLDAVQ